MKDAERETREDSKDLRASSLTCWVGNLIRNFPLTKSKISQSKVSGKLVERWAPRSSLDTCDDNGVTIAQKKKQELVTRFVGW